MSVPARKVRTIAPKPAMMTPFYFFKAGSLIEAKALIAGAGLITVFLAMKMVTKFVGILPLTRYFKFDKREGMYTTLMMSTGLTFGSISALFGLTNHIIDQEQYTILLTAVIGSAVVPTLIAQVWFPTSFRAVGGRCLVHSANVRFGSLADILRHQRDVRFVPIADICQRSMSGSR